MFAAMTIDPCGGFFLAMLGAAYLGKKLLALAKEHPETANVAAKGILAQLAKWFR